MKVVTPQSMETTKTFRSQPFLEHVQEFRRRLVYVALAMTAAGGVGDVLRGPLMELVQAPLREPLYYTSPIGGFEFLFKVCFFFALITTTPYFLYQLYRFLEPAMPYSSRRFVAGMIFSSICLLVIGVSFAYFLSLPAALHFLAGFSTEGVRPLISTSSYLSFVTAYLAGFGILFQLPLIVLIINRITPLGPGSLMRRQGLIIIGAFLLSAILTPTPDPLNMTIMALPVIGLYQCSILLVVWVNRRRRREIGRSLRVALPIENSQGSEVTSPTPNSRHGGLQVVAHSGTGETALPILPEWIRVPEFIHTVCGEGASVWAYDARVYGCGICQVWAREEDPFGVQFRFSEEGALAGSLTEPETSLRLTPEMFHTLDLRSNTA